MITKFQKYSEQIREISEAIRFLRDARNLVSDEKARTAIDKKIRGAEDTLNRCSHEIEKLSGRKN